MWETPEVVIGQIVALKMLHFSDRDATEKITEWGLAICKATVIRWWIRYEEGGEIQNHQENSSRSSMKRPRI
jgi:transposase